MLRTLCPPLTRWGFPLLRCQQQRQPKSRRSSRDLRTRAGGPGPCRDEALRAGGSCAAEGGGGRREEEELRSTGPGASPLTALGSDAFAESRRERNKVWFFFSLLLRSRPPLQTAAPRSPATPAVPACAGEPARSLCFFSSFPRVYFFFFKFCTICFRFPAILERGCLSWGVSFGGGGACFVCGCWVQDEEQKYLWR